MATLTPLPSGIGQLTPGMSGASVTALQNWLIQNGYPISAGATGYYGAETSAAVLALQKNLGIDYSSGPGDFGPLTQTAVQKSFMNPANSPSNQVPNAQAGQGGTATASSTTSTTGGSGAGTSSTSSTISSSNAIASTDPSYNTAYGQTTPDQAAALTQYGISAKQWNETLAQGSPAATQWLSNAMAQYTPPTSGTDNTNGDTSTTTDTTGTTGTSGGLSYNPAWANYGIDQTAWNSMTAMQQATVGAILGVAQAQYSTTGTKITYQQALQIAATDPTIASQYADAQKIDTLAFQQNLQQIQTAASTSGQQQQQQFETDRLALANTSAAAGQAYSGFRGKAQDNLSQTESGIVTSSRAALQAQLDQATSAFESKYGSAATTPAVASFINPYISAGTDISGLNQPGANQTPESLTGTTAGGITGSAVTGKQQAINSLAQTYATIPGASPVTPA